MAATLADACIDCNCTDVLDILHDVYEGLDTTWPWNDIDGLFVYRPWVFSLLGSTMVGLTGIFPLWLIPIQDGVDLKTGENGGTLKILLSFAVGALLGDVFLHLLPEAFESEFQRRAEDSEASTPAGLWILSAFLFFVIFEKIIAAVNEEAPIITEQQTDDEASIQDTSPEKEMDNNNCITLMNTETAKNGYAKEYLRDNNEMQIFLRKQSDKNGFVQIPIGMKELRKNGFNKDVNVMKSALASKCPNDGPLMDETKICLKKLAKSNGFTSALLRTDEPATLPKNMVGRLIIKANKLMSDLSHAKFFNPQSFPGYLNLLMNFLDNFTHGLSVGGSFLISFRVGILSTFTILVHEIPHEVGDFAILLRSGFSRWGAARAQLVTAGGGIVGALAAVFFSSGLEEKTNWILPLTAGGFIHIGLVTILPDLLRETNPMESLKQLCALLFGVAVMAALMFV
ncbi:zinc transporter ZIP13 [Harpegnathos saltator]|nr:zinc transporter ZIP13 [Harpegnathos saltator]